MYILLRSRPTVATVVVLYSLELVAGVRSATRQVKIGHFQAISAASWLEPRP